MSAQGMSGRLSTELGERSTYDAVSQCSRCGYCAQACPTYVATGEEGLSPRGRNQALRMLLEGKLREPATARRLLDSCLLCGACSSACYARIPVPELVLEGRRLLRRRAPVLARLICWLQLERPRWLEGLLGAAYRLKRLGLARLAGPLGLPALALADEQAREAPLRLLAPELRERSELGSPEAARFFYFAACGTNYVLPRVGHATVAVLQDRGRTCFLDNPCCGLIAYNYGELEHARALARRVIEGAERALARGTAEAALVADCSSCVAHLKAYPRLFLKDPAWKGRAGAFAKRVRDAVEVMGPPGGGRGPRDERGTYHDSCRLRHGQGIFEQPRRFMRAAFSDFVELPQADVCCGGAGAYAFLQPELSDETLRRKIAAIAETGARVVVASSTSCLLQLAHGLRKYYPECRAAHPSELTAAGLAGRSPAVPALDAIP